MPPWLKYSASRGVSMRTRALNSARPPPARREGGAARLHVAHGGVVDRQPLARSVGEIAGEAAFGQGVACTVEQVAQADVRERAAHHQLVVAAARAVRVEVPGRHPLLL